MCDTTTEGPSTTRPAPGLARARLLRVIAHPPPRGGARVPRVAALAALGLLALALGACSGVPPPETVNRDLAGNGQPVGGWGNGWGGGTGTQSPGQAPSSWGASEADPVIETRYVNGVQVGVPAGPLGGKPGDCNCRVPVGDAGGIVDDPAGGAGFEGARPTYRDGTVASFEGQEIDPLEGKAAWFGAEMNDTPTTQGDARQQWGVFAAHPSLPYGTRVEVTNLKNKRKTEVIINDRTNVGGQLILLVSEGVANALDMKRHGVVPVKLRVVRRGE